MVVVNLLECRGFVHNYNAHIGDPILLMITSYGAISHGSSSKIENWPFQRKCK